MPPRQVPEPEVLERLVEAVEAVTGQIKVLTDVMDEIRSEIQWGARNPDRFRGQSPILHLTSMPKTPLDPEFGAKIIRVPPIELARLRKEAQPQGKREPASLFV